MTNIISVKNASKIFLVLSFGLILMLTLSQFASAQLGIGEGSDFETQLATGEDNLLTEKLPITVGRIINAFLGVLGIIAVIIIIIGGFKWMTAGGNEEKVGEAKNLLIAGIIGLIIILAAYSIASFVIEKVTA